MDLKCHCPANCAHTKESVKRLRKNRLFYFLKTLLRFLHSCLFLSLVVVFDFFFISQIRFILIRSSLRIWAWCPCYLVSERICRSSFLHTTFLLIVCFVSMACFFTTGTCTLNKRSLYNPQLFFDFLKLIILQSFYFSAFVRSVLY